MLSGWFGGATLDSSGSFSRASPALHQCSIHRTSVRVYTTIIHVNTPCTYFTNTHTHTHQLTQQHPSPISPPPSTWGIYIHVAACSIQNVLLPLQLCNKRTKLGQELFWLKKKWTTMIYNINNHLAQLIVLLSWSLLFFKKFLINPSFKRVRIY